MRQVRVYCFATKMLRWRHCTLDGCCAVAGRVRPEGSRRQRRRQFYAWVEATQQTCLDGRWVGISSVSTDLKEEGNPTAA